MSSLRETLALMFFSSKEEVREHTLGQMMAVVLTRYAREGGKDTETPVGFFP